MFLAPERWDRQHPSNLRWDNLPNLISELLNGLIRDILYSLGDHWEQRHLPSIQGDCVSVHMKQVHFVLRLGKTR